MKYPCCGVLPAQAPGSIWSKLNTGHAERLIREGRMKDTGMVQIEVAKADWRWARPAGRRRSGYSGHALRRPGVPLNRKVSFLSVDYQCKYGIWMARNVKSMLALLMGIVILIADLYWMYTSYAGWGAYYDALWTALGIVILVADLIWLYIDWSFSKKY